MDWRIKSINHRTTPAREREQTCATEAEFERAVKYALDWTRPISATLPDGTVLDESEVRRRYGAPKWTLPANTRRHWRASPMKGIEDGPSQASSLRYRERG
jgi:hypothetical protein